MKTDTKRTKPTPLARRMWANYYRDASVLHETRKMAAHCAAPGAAHEVVPVAVVPLDDVDALIAKATAAFLVEDRKPESWTLDDCMTAALTAIGVLPKRKGGRK